MSNPNKTRAGSISSQCIQALKEVPQQFSLGEPQQLKPLLPEGLTQREEAFREHVWLKAFAEYCASKGEANDSA